MLNILYSSRESVDIMEGEYIEEGIENKPKDITEDRYGRKLLRMIIFVTIFYHWNYRILRYWFYIYILYQRENTYSSFPCAWIVRFLYRFFLSGNKRLCGIEKRKKTKESERVYIQMLKQTSVKGGVCHI